jgi:hypothetical protein
LEKSPGTRIHHRIRFLQTITYLFVKGNVWTLNGTYGAMTLTLGFGTAKPNQLYQFVVYLGSPKGLW